MFFVIGGILVLLILMLVLIVLDVNSIYNDYEIMSRSIVYSKYGNPKVQSQWYKLREI
jgi:hypothetical protein